MEVGEWGRKKKWEGVFIFFFVFKKTSVLCAVNHTHHAALKYKVDFYSYWNKHGCDPLR